MGQFNSALGLPMHLGEVDTARKYYCPYLIGAKQRVDSSSNSCSYFFTDNHLVMKKAVFSVLVFLLFFQCESGKEAPVQQAPPSTLELEQLIIDYYDIMSDRDWAAYAEYFTEKAVLTTVWQAPQDSVPTMNLNTISDFLAHTAEGPDSQPIFEEKPTEIEISRRGEDLAAAWVRYDAKFGTEAQLMTWSGYDLFSFIKYGGEWKIASLTYASVE